MAASEHPISEPKYEVTPLELFFDLVFVFGVSQLSHHLLAHLSWRGTAETLVMLAAIFAVWFSTSWSATLIRADESRTRGLLLAVMLLGLFMNAAVTWAFTRSGWAFITPLLLIQIGRAVWTFVNVTEPVLRDHYFRLLVWLLPTTPLWVAGALADPDARLGWWALATLIDQLGRWLSHPVPGRRLHSENIPFDADHMLERNRLFLIIALGETVLTTGTAISEAPLSLLTAVTGAFALAGTVALWALSFGRAHRLIQHHVEASRDPIRVSRHAVNSLMVVVAGLIAVAVANERVIAHPEGHTSIALSLLLGGGPILFLAAHGWYLWFISNVRPHLYWIGGAALALIGCVSPIAPPYLALMLVGTSLVTLALFNEWRCRR